MVVWSPRRSAGGRRAIRGAEEGAPVRIERWSGPASLRSVATVSHFSTPIEPPTHAAEPGTDALRERAKTSLS